MEVNRATLEREYFRWEGAGVRSLAVQHHPMQGNPLSGARVRNPVTGCAIPAAVTLR
jgi:hypothetical protein